MNIYRAYELFFVPKTVLNDLVQDNRIYFERKKLVLQKSWDFVLYRFKAHTLKFSFSRKVLQNLPNFYESAHNMPHIVSKREVDP